MSEDLEEKEILKFWNEKKIYEKSIKKNKEGEGFFMMDGPPYATGKIHLGTALNKISKDIAMRSQRLQGKAIFDKAGYDTHGVPIEYKVEKEIGSKSKKDIEKYGIKKFIDRCKHFATQNIEEMNKQFEDLGIWMDFKNPYLTLDEKYIETIWDVFKEAKKKKLLYLGKYPIHVCPRCETAVSFNEIEYSKFKDNSIFVKFPLKKEKNTFLIIWTTTPWTLPANAAIMVAPKIDYQLIELSNGEKWIIAKELVKKLTEKIGASFKVLKEIKGEEMEGWEYENPLKKNLRLKTKNAYKIILSGRFVTTEEGTGLVHCAPGHGKEDYDASRKYDIDIISPIKNNGCLTEETGKYEGGKAREIDKEIIKDLDEAGMLVHQEKHLHDYPVCWRCKSPLLMMSQPQWFLKISQIQKKIIEDNEKITWVPSWAKLRMKGWLEGLSDWPVSRNRYWGTPLPIWVCDKCKEIKVVGSIKELETLYGKKIKGIHKPEIDEVKFKCDCGGEMRRINSVLDVWFDSGVSSWAVLNYLEDKKAFKKFWPADLNIEGKDQIRGWWNSQLILSEIKFGKKPFKTIMLHGMILDLFKNKMSKSKGNIITPGEIIEKYGRDKLRYFFAKTSKGEDFKFNEDNFKDTEKIFRMILNINKFINGISENEEKLRTEDKWILSKFNRTIKDIKKYYNDYNFPKVVKKFEEFLGDLSRTYIKMIRDRPGETFKILNQIREDSLKLLAPICPFLTERLWQELRTENKVKEESIHLSSFPEVEERLIDEDLEKEMDLILKIIEQGLAERDKIKLGLKWPSQKVFINSEEEIGKRFYDIIKKGLNVKEIEIKKSKEFSVKIDERLSPELEAEGYARVLSRNIQNMRKKAGLKKEDKIEIILLGNEELIKILERKKVFIEERTNSKSLKFGKISEEDKGTFKKKETFKIKERDVEVRINF